MIIAEEHEKELRELPDFLQVKEVCESYGAAFFYPNKGERAELAGQLVGVMVMHADPNVLDAIARDLEAVSAWFPLTARPEKVYKAKIFFLASRRWKILRQIGQAGHGVNPQDLRRAWNASAELREHLAAIEALEDRGFTVEAFAISTLREKVIAIVNEVAFGLCPLEPTH